MFGWVKCFYSFSLENGLLVRFTSKTLSFTWKRNISLQNIFSHKYLFPSSDQCQRSGRVLLSFCQGRGGTVNIHTSPDHPFFVFGQARYSQALIGPAQTLLCSHWSRASQWWNIFSSAIKTQLKTPKVPSTRGISCLSLVFYGIRELA